ncbi:MAG: lysyl oxidase family protein, partial [Bacteroidota bacterium]
MRSPLFLLFFLYIGSISVLHAQCGPNENHIRLEIDPDQYWEEVSWQITDQTGSTVYAAGHLFADSLHVFNYCTPKVGGCTIFKIADAYGDGIFPDGHYKLFVNDSLIRDNPNGNYNFGEMVRFGCPLGAYCDNPIMISQPDTFTTLNALESWYRFVPDSTGTYTISTCDLGNTCPSKIWVYSMCNGITLAENQTGAIFFANGNCPDGSSAKLELAGGHEYFFRIRYTSGDCNNTPLHWSLKYAGPVVGCTDPTACNYNPLAMVSDTCLYDGNPDCPNKPDLLVRQDVLINTMHLDFIANADACMVQEGCLRGVGNRNIIRFTTQIQNIGAQDYYIGETPASPTTPSDQFVWDPCHNHWHYKGYAEYVLYDAAGNGVPVGSKNGFCVLDLECSNGGSGKYSCNNMGVTAGCGDIYDSSLPCQWIDITNLLPGTYTLAVRVNWDKSPDKVGRVEASYDNNWGQVCFNLSYDSQNLPVLDVLENDCPPVIDCNGVAFGDAQLDCNGVCGGPALKGDLNQDTVRNVADVQAYLAASLAGNGTVSTCNELYEDNQINIYDAAMLQECTLHHDDVNYWGVRFPCTFPSGLTNDKDIVYILPGKVDTVAKTFDVQMVNPYNKIYGYEFSVSGLEIQSVENLDVAFDGAIQFNTNGKILALTPTETAIKKNILPGNLLRIHYSKRLGSTLCIASVDAIVNSKYQKSAGLVGIPTCVTINETSGTHNPDQQMAVFAQPNPFSDATTLFFSNP